uniref:Oxidation resistance protein 1 n=1 Tax=Panagrellus redivivus TaxID=6233 RepID=A0A7E4VDG3_PANRE
MNCRMVFPGQHIRVPIPQDPPPPSESQYSPLPSSPNKKSPRPSGLGDFVFLDTDETQIKPPGGAVRQTRLASDASNISVSSRKDSAKSNSIQPMASVDPEDNDCLRRFLKIKVKQVTESDGTVTGTLLITPNTIMFDPDLIHPLVKENGPDLYGMVAPMDDIVSVSVFKHDHSLVESEDRRSSSESESKPTFDCGATSEDEFKDANDVFADNSDGSLNGSIDGPPVSLSIDASSLPAIAEEANKGTPNTPGDQNSLAATGNGDVIKRRAASDLGPVDSSVESVSVDLPDRPRTHSDLQPSTSLDSSAATNGKQSPFSRFSPGMTRRSFGRLGRTLSSRANSIKGTVTSVASGTQRVAHGVVTHTKSAADQIHAGIQTGAKAVASVPGSLANVGSGILAESHDLYGSFVAELKGDPEKKNPTALKREKSLAQLHSLKQRTHEARQASMAQNTDDVFAKACTSDEMAELFPSIQDMTTGQQPPVIGTPPDPPMYMTIRVDRKRMTKRKRINYDDAYGTSRHASVSSGNDHDHNSFGNKHRCEFWYAIPRASADAIYHFLLIWSPGQQNEASLENNADTNDENAEDPRNTETGLANKKGLIVLDSKTDDTKLLKDNLGNQTWFGASAFGSGLVREWEITTVKELCRRLSLDDDCEMAETALPEGATQSQILDEFMIRQIAEILPPRAQGYPWVLIYNSEKHGFSLSTLFRKMEAWVDEMSPILLIIRDVKGHVFGAMVSQAIRPSDHYFGTGECFLFRFTGKVPHTRELRHYEWAGDNQFFVNACKTHLSIGAGQGHSGLWLDADLNHGRSQRCLTFDNEPLAGGQDEDFIVQFVEAFGFSM